VSDVAPWLGPQRDTWLADAERWIAASESDIGEVVAISPVRERPWGAVLRVDATQGTFFFKAEGAGGHHEIPLLADIAASWPGLVPRVLRTDHDREWLLMADDGVPMWELTEPQQQVAIYADLLPSYAEMQRASTGLIDAWIGAGVPDRRMHRLPDLLRGLLAGDGLADESLPLTSDVRRGIDALLPTFERVCAELAAIPDALDHGDMHGGNVLVRSDEHRLVDWGDAQITHPFATLLITYQVDFVHRRKDGHPLPDTLDRVAASRRLRDAYLEPWTDVAPARELHAMFANALWVTHVCRAIDYAKLFAGLRRSEIPQWLGEIADLLTDWYERRTLLGSDEMIDAVWSGPTR
jgi:hypothetical protein